MVFITFQITMIYLAVATSSKHAAQRNVKGCNIEALIS